jgi:hypothetical protein
MNPRSHSPTLRIVRLVEASECTGPDKVRSAARTGGGRALAQGRLLSRSERAWHRPEFPKSWNSDRFETSVVRSFSHVPTGPSVRGLVFAAHARMVSACQIWLNCRESARLFKEIFCDDISEFESFKPSQADCLHQCKCECATGVIG